MLGIWTVMKWVIYLSGVARNLYTSSPASCLLRESTIFIPCHSKGYINQKDNRLLVFLFGFRSGASQSEPVSFSDLIETKKSSDRLNLPDRFIVAQTIVKAVTAFHADGWVHKSIRSQSIKFFQNNGSLQRYSQYLVDFEYSRPRPLLPTSHMTWTTRKTSTDTQVVKNPLLSASARCMESMHWGSYFWKLVCGDCSIYLWRYLRQVGQREGRRGKSL